MPGLVPGIHVLKLTRKEDVDGRDKPGHDEFKQVNPNNISVTGNTPWPSSSQKNNRCCATARAA
jgi:hypothetical protein